jgi:hypothetical protein
MPLNEFKDSTAVCSTVKGALAGISGLEFPSVTIVVKIAWGIGPANSGEKSIGISQNSFDGLGKIVTKWLDWMSQDFRINRGEDKAKVKTTHS